MKKVYICSPCRGDYENNIQRAKEYSRAAVEKGVIPVTPHIYLTQFMDDNVPEERELALKIGSELVLGCSELWAFGIDHPSAGMAAEIELAKAHGIPVRNGQFLACYTKQAQPDYGGTLKGGRSIYFEAKHTDDERIEQRRLTQEQQDDLEAHHELGAIAFVLVSVSLTDFYRVPWPVWRDMAEIYGRKYMTHAELSRYEVPATAGFIKFLHGIEEVTT